MRNDEEYMTLDLSKIFYQIMNNIVTIVLVTLVTALAGFLISAFLIKPTYSASAQMLVNNRNEQQTTAITQSDINASSSLVNTYSIILKSHDVLEKVIDDCNLNCTSESLSRMVSVSSVNSTQVMKITVQSKNAQQALEICTDLVKLAPDAIVKAMDEGSVTTVSSPYTTGRPDSPSKRKYTMFGALLGLIACLGVIVFKEITNDKFKTTEDIRTVLDLNILGVIPEETLGAAVKTKSKKTRTIKRRKSK